MVSPKKGSGSYKVGAEAGPIKALLSVISIIESLVLFLPCVLQVSLRALALFNGSISTVCHWTAPSL